MAETKATPAKKAERKKPVRKAPKQSDYASRIEWLSAMLKYEEQQTAAENKAKVERLDKRIAAKQTQVDALTAELDKLKAERTALVPDEAPDPAAEAVGDKPTS